MEKLLLFCLVGVTTLYSQETKPVKDAVYVLFESGKNQVIQIPEYDRPLKALDPYICYIVYFDKHKKSYFTFYRSEYLNMDSLDADKKAEVKNVNKSFLKENKEDIIDMETLLKAGIEKSYWNFGNYQKNISYR